MEFPSDRISDLKRLLSVLALVFTTSLMLFSYLWRNVQMSRARYEISQLKKERRKLYLEVEELRINVAKQSTASRVEELIRQKYGYLPVRMSQKITTLKVPKIEVPEAKQPSK